MLGLTNGCCVSFWLIENTNKFMSPSMGTWQHSTKPRSIYGGRYQILAATESARFDAIAKLAMTTTTTKKNDYLVYHMKKGVVVIPRRKKTKSSPSPELQHVHDKKTKYDTKKFTSSSRYRKDDEDHLELSQVPHKTKDATNRLPARPDHGKNDKVIGHVVVIIAFSIATIEGRSGTTAGRRCR